MELLSGFAWPVPRAFAGAVSACRFEQGDVFYSDPAGYEAWVAGGPRPGLCVQVLDPPKSARALAGESDGKRFFSNWSSPVQLTLGASDPAGGRRLATTQGRLFTGLWRGDERCFEPTGEEPEAPLLQRDLHKRLDEVADYFRSCFEARLGQADRCIYLSAVDEASDASLVKAHGIESLLTERAKAEVEQARPADAGLDGAERFHPALVLRAVAVPGADPAPVEKLLSGLLYAGAGESGTGRFSLARHGLLLTPAAEPEPETA